MGADTVVISGQFEVARLTRTEVAAFVETVAPGDVTVTGWVGSGYSTVTAVLGDDVHHIELHAPWTTRYLLMMRDPVSPLAGASLRDPVLDAAVTQLRHLELGGGLLVTRADTCE